MLEKLPTFVRLLLCLLLSAGLHGGLTSLGWIKSPVEVLLPHAPVEVSFLPVVDVVPKALREEQSAPPQPVSPPQPPSPVKPPPIKKPRPTVKKEEAQPASMPEEHLNVEVDVEDDCRPSRDPLCDAPLESTDTLPVAIQDKEPVTITKSESEITASDSLAQEKALVEAIPRYSSNPLPEYPYRARQRRWEGVVWLLVDVSSEGVVDDLSVEQSSGYKILDRSAIKSVRRWRFVPATRAGLPVASKVRIPVRFHLEGG